MKPFTTQYDYHKQEPIFKSPTHADFRSDSDLA